ncbi:alpha/beta hydrolase [Modestobacter marinus]|uniref:Acetyl esterase/lipase n=1 Tax=Modestobacter marinus TaxID=477641 RepID=A0A846LS45_9ACTN|nr:alpha/beta hydrolase [Modestobacter marinus]NIH68228.1 acetyl esterase/lipase [Modestobacter marinus]GGL79413.1 carboxylesterase [Modestobacter marinus]
MNRPGTAVRRALADGLARLVQKAPGAARIDPDIAFAEIPGRTQELTIPTRHGELRATAYLPDGGSAGHGVYVNLHGGGFVLRHPEQDDPLCRYLAAEAGVTVLNVDYVPAPQSRFPGPVEQAYDLTVWAASPERPWHGSRLAVGGQSAGGALAAGAARLALEQGADHIALQVLLYPPLDLTVPARSKAAEGKETFLVRMGPVFDTVYCPDVARRADRLISPAAATDTADLTGIAPAVVVTAEKDILREEGVRYAERLAGAGALVEHLDLPGVGHGFNILNAPRDVVLAAYEGIARHTTRALS